MIELLIMPLGCSILLLLAGVIVRHRTISTAFLISGLTILYLFSIPITGRWLSQRLEIYPAISLPVHTDAQAIVVLGGGSYLQAPEYGTDSLKKWALERVRYAAWLHQRTGLPILTSGGKPVEQDLPEAMIARNILENEFAAHVQWVEPKSRTTQENARYSCEILKQAKIKKILLVTHAWHMPRSMNVFKQHCAEITHQAAPTLFSTLSPLTKGSLAWVPAAGALEQNTLYLHEIVGYFWYQLRY